MLRALLAVAVLASLGAAFLLAYLFIPRPVGAAPLIRVPRVSVKTLRGTWLTPTLPSSGVTPEIRQARLFVCGAVAALALVPFLLTGVPFIQTAWLAIGAGIGCHVILELIWSSRQQTVGHRLNSQIGHAVSNLIMLTAGGEGTARSVIRKLADAAKAPLKSLLEEAWYTLRYDSIDEALAPWRSVGSKALSDLADLLPRVFAAGPEDQQRLLTDFERRLSEENETVSNEHIDQLTSRQLTLIVPIGFGIMLLTVLAPEMRMILVQMGGAS